MIVLIVVNVLFIVLAALFINVKATFLIAGYNTTHPEEKAKYDIIALSKFLGKTMFAISGSFFLLILGNVFNSNGLSITATILLVAISLVALVHTSTSKRFRKTVDAA